ncbi:MAG: sigma-70 family RNA polymerase sigma factor [Acidobacteriota bacterium]
MKTRPNVDPPPRAAALSLRASDPRLADFPASEALPVLMDEHGGQLYRLSLDLCGHPEDAEDLVQEIFLIALRKWDRFRGDAKPTTWLYTIAVRACRRRRRRRAGEPRTVESLTALLPSPDDPIPDVAALEGPLDQQLRKEARDAVEQAIARLPWTYRMPLVLKEIVELSIADVGAILNLERGTVKTRVHRARLRLRRELSRTLPQKGAPPQDHARKLCLDLLEAKQGALDRGVPFRVSEDVLCERCRAMFGTLDLTREVCRLLGRGEMPPGLRSMLEKRFRGG